MGTNTDTVNVEISKDLIAPIIQAKIKMAILEELGAKDDLIGQVVDRMLNDKVDDTGKKNSSSYRNEHTFIDIAIKNAIHEAIEEGVSEWVLEHKGLIKESLGKQLEARKTRDAMAKAMVDGLVSATRRNWAISTNFSFESVDEQKASPGEMPF